MATHPRRRFADWALVVLAIVVLLVGLPMAVGGAYLVYLGGSWYFVLAGLVVTAAGILLFADSSTGVWLLVAVAVGTLVWSLWEIAEKGWMPAWIFDLMARMGLLTVLAVIALLLLPTLRRRARASER